MPRLPRQLESLARMLTYILSHRPDEFGLVLSEEGFIPIKLLLQALGAEPGWGFVRRYHLDQLVGLMSPPAFEVDQERIRALTPQPASLRRDLGEPPLPCSTPPFPPRPTPGCGRRGSSRPRTGNSSWPRPRSWRTSWGAAGPRTPYWSPSRPRRRPGAASALQAMARVCTWLLPCPGNFSNCRPRPRPWKSPNRKNPGPPAPTPGSFTLDLPGMLPPAAKPRSKGKKAEPDWKAGTRALRKQREKGEKGKGRKA